MADFCETCGKELNKKKGQTRFCCLKCYHLSMTNKPNFKNRKYNFLDTIAKENSIYNLWQHIKSRCYIKSDKRYYCYGGRNIAMCDEWKDNFKAFYDWVVANGYQEGLSIERIDVNGNYEPNNCKWIPLEEQGWNKSNTHWVIYKDEKKCLAEVAKIEGINRDNLYRTIKKYNNLEEAIKIAKMNNQGLKSTNKTGYVGIYPKGKKWYAKYKEKYLGTFDTKEQAIQAREEYKNRTKQMSC